MGLSIIYQELNLVNTMTVGENIFLGRFSESGGRSGVHSKARSPAEEHRIQGRYPQAGV